MKSNKKISQDILDTLADKIRVRKITHLGWLEQQRAKKRYANLFMNKNMRFLTKMFGKNHYFYKNSRGELSLIKVNSLGFRKNLKLKEEMIWEVLDLSNKETYRFDTKKQAEKKIEEILGGKIR